MIRTITLLGLTAVIERADEVNSVCTLFISLQRVPLDQYFSIYCNRFCLFLCWVAKFDQITFQLHFVV